MDRFDCSVWLNIDNNTIISDDKYKDLSKKEAVVPAEFVGRWVCVCCECVDTDIIDCGIGEYEFWGSTYYDDRTEVVPTEFEHTIEAGEVLGRETTDEDEDVLEEYELTKEQESLIDKYILADY